jgi:hypothetical protein
MSSQSNESSWAPFELNKPLRTPSGSIAVLVQIHLTAGEGVVQWPNGERGSFRLALLRPEPPERNDPESQTSIHERTQQYATTTQGLLALVQTGVLGVAATVDAKLQQAQDGSGPGAQDISGKGDFTRVTESTESLAPGSGAGVNVDFSKGGSGITTSGTNAITFINVPSGAKTHLVYVDNFNHVTWPGSVSFGAGGAPSIAGAAFVSLTTFDGGTTVYASVFFQAV